MKQIAVMIETSRAYGRALMEGIAAYAQQAGDWKLRSLANGRVTAKTLRGYDGLIIRLADRTLASAIRATGLPAVDVYGDRPPETKVDKTKGDRPQADGDIPVADGDHRLTGEMAADFFQKRGFQHFAWCGVDGLSFSDQRGDGFCRALEVKGFTPLRYTRPRRIRADSSLFYDERLDRVPDAAELAKWLQSLPHPTAVFCCHDYRAYQLMLVASDLGLRIPHELAILGVDNDTTLCSFAPVPISSIDPNAFQVGFAAARMLKDAMDGRRVGSSAVAPSRIVERESTEFIPVETPWLSDALMFIEKNYARGISAADVIRRAGRSSTFVERVFRQKTGVSILAYLTRLRMAEAESLLATTDLMVKEIGLRCGYRSAQYFCRVFTSYHGRSPLAVRESARQGTDAST